MDSIKHIQNTSSEFSRLDKNKNIKTLKDNSAINQEKDSTNVKSDRDLAQISNAARELLALDNEAKQYVNKIKSADVLSPEDIQKVKERVESKYYLNPNVVNNIVDKLTSLPTYLNNKVQSSGEE